jgi:SpoIID/LytB domain protein
VVDPGKLRSLAASFQKTNVPTFEGVNGQVIGLSTAARKKVSAFITGTFLAGTLLSGAGWPAAKALADDTGGFAVVREDGFPVAPGVSHKGMTLQGGGHIEAVNMMEVDPSNPVIKLEVTSPKGKVVALDTVRNQAKQIDRDGYRVVGGFNMDFYNTDPSFAGVPNGMQISNGELITAPAWSQTVLAVMPDNSFAIKQNVGFTGTVKVTDTGSSKALNGVNRIRSTSAANQTILYSDKFSDTTKSSGAGVEVVLAPAAGTRLELNKPIQAQVESIADTSNTAIPPGKFVLSATGTDADWMKANLAAGKTVELNLQLDNGVNSAVQAVSGGGMLVQNGAATPGALADNVDRHPRTFVAVKAGKLYFITFDGRQPTYSDGVTLAEGAQYLQSLGMETAFNVDGGGSTTYAARLPGDQSLSVLNRPSDGFERSNSNSLMIVSTAPVTELKYLVPQPKGPITVLEGSTIAFTSKGQDVSYNGVPVDPASLTWEAESGVGTITAQGVFVAASTPGAGKVTVRSGGVSEQVAVTVTDQIARLTIAPNPAVVNPGAVQTFTAQAFDAAGNEIVLSPDRLMWGEEGGIGTISAGGVLTASSQVVSGKVTAAYGSVKAEAVVNIGKPPVMLEDFEDVTDIAVSTARANSAKLDLVSRPNPVRYGTHAGRLSYDFTGTIGTSAAYMNFKDPDGSAGRSVEGYPMKLGLWVYGDANNHWLRGQIQDGNGTKKPIDFTATGGLNWTGWKYVTADIPAGMAVPLKLTQVYVVETSNANKNSGAVVFDHLRAIYSDTGEDLEGPVFSGQTPAPGKKVYVDKPAISAVVTDAGQGVDAGSIVMKLNNTVVAHQFDAATGQITYTPSEALADGTYTVTIDATDNAGNPAVPRAEWSFTVYTGPDVDPPQLDVISPMDGITTRTDQPRLAVKVTDDYSGTDSARLKLELDGTVVPHQYDEASGTVYYTPESKLANGSQHAVKLTAADKAGNEAVAAWSFTVGSPLGQPANPEKFQMSIIGDGGYYTAGQGQTAADILLREQISRINNEASELVGYTGDIVENDTAANFATGMQNLNLFKAPYVVTIGNHEISGTGSRVDYQKTFGEPTYVYDYGNTRIIGLDSASGMISNSDASQWPWLEQMLQQTDKPNILVFMHIPPDEISASGEDFKTGHGFQNPEEAARFYDLLGSYKSAHADKNIVVLSGDLHAYSYKKVQGVDYIISGGGGKYTHITPEKGGFYHYLNMKIDGSKITWDVIPLLDQIVFTAVPDRLAVNQQFQLKADGKFMTSTNDPITLPVAAPFKVEWTSSAPDVASVDEQGIITGKKQGEATITVKSGNREATTTIRVADSAAFDKIELSGLAPMETGDVLQAKASIVLADGSKVPAGSGVQFTSSNAGVARVTSEGYVTALDAGQTVITATYGTLSDTYTLQVSPYTPAALQEKIMAKNPPAKTIELELSGVQPLADAVVVQQTVNGQTADRSLNDVMVGSDNATVYINKAGQVFRIAIEGETPMNRMRVGIRKDISNIADMTQLDHAQVDLKSAQGIKLTDKIACRTFDVQAGSTVTFTVEAGQIKAAVNGTELYRTANRLYAAPAAQNGQIQIASITRAQGQPQYRGVLEVNVSPAKNMLRVINELDIEQYLYQVVPSEMPASFGLEALKAQAVAARTYALSDYMSNRFADQGFHIDDSTLSQVYNNSAENDMTDQAVNETAGKIMKYGGELVDARFYSTSGGYGASRHEVWADPVTNWFPGTPAPYLTARSYTYDPADSGKLLIIDTQDEQQVSAFYKTLSYTGYDSDSLYFRWKVGLTKTELQNTINANLAGRYAADPNFILTKQEDGTFASKPIPAAGIGTFKNMYVAKRGAGGNITELVVEGSTGTYKIVKEFNIRFTIRPSKTYTGGGDVLAYRAKGGSAAYDPAGTLKNPSILYSAFFTFDLTKDANGDVTAVTFYGGGNGHGVGMSQYGASMLGGKGWSYDRILDAYYNGMQLSDIPGTNLSLTGIELSGLASTMKVGETRHAQVTASYSNGTSGRINAGVTYTSSRPEVATVSPTGDVTAVGYGSTTITASYGGRTAQADIRVAPDLSAIQLGGLAPMTVGETKQSVVTVTYADGSVTNVTYGVTFTSSRPEVASVSATGLVTALSAGETEIAALYQGKESRYLLKVSPALVAIQIGGLGPMREGDTLQTVVTATYSDGSAVPLLSGVTFASSRPDVASVDPSGLVTAKAPGETTITAAYNGKTASFVVQVTAGLVRLELTKLKPMKEGETRQLTVIATYSDGTKQDVTSRASFTSGDPQVATVAPGGLLTAVSKGKTEITAAFGRWTDSDKLNVTPDRKDRK